MNNYSKIICLEENHLNLIKCILEENNDNYIKSGFDELDKYIKGFRNGTFNIIGGRPSSGKTSFALSIVLNQVFENKKIGIISLEISNFDIDRKLYSMLNFIKFKDVNNYLYNIFKSEKDKIEYNSKFKNIFLSNNVKELSDIENTIRLMKEINKIDILYIDYFSLINVKNNNFKNQYEKSAEVSKRLKQLALELNLPIVCLSQLNREAEKETPTLASLRDTGALEQDADVILFINNLKEEKEKNEIPFKYEINNFNKIEITNGDVNIIEKEIIIAKNRNGEKGKSELYFVENYTIFKNKKEIKLLKFN